MSTLAHEIRTHLAEANPEAILYEGGSIDNALIGVGSRCGQPDIAIYSYDKLVQSFVDDGMDDVEAMEWVNFNILGAWLGEHTPIIQILEGSEDE